MKRYAITIVVLLLAAGCADFAHVGGVKVPLVFKADFEDGKLDAWQATDPAAWRIEDKNGGKALALFKQSKYSPLASFLIDY